jgi:hypothetical protein
MTNHTNRVIRRPHWTVAAVVATAALVLLGAACGGSPSSIGPSSSSNAGGTTNSQSSSSQMLPFASCMRSNGVPNFPDPNSSEKFPGAQQLGVSSSLYQSAMNACKHLLPNGGNAPSQTELRQEETALLPFAQCMRSHGVSDWPDPSIYTNSDGQTAVVFNFIGTSLDGSGFDSPQVQAKSNACQHLLPPSLSDGAYRIVRSHG